MNKQIPIGWEEDLCLYALDESCNDNRDLELKELDDPKSPTMFKYISSNNGLGCPVYPDRRRSSVK